jgi:hypothetical protein
MIWKIMSNGIINNMLFKSGIAGYRRPPASLEISFTNQEEDTKSPVTISKKIQTGRAKKIAPMIFTQDFCLGENDL